MQDFPELRFQVTWKPFFLNPSIPEEGVTMGDYLRAVYGPRDFSASRMHLKNMGQGLGIAFNGSDTTMIYPTIKSHCLIEIADKQGLQNECMERVFKKYFDELGSLNSTKDLMECASDVGVKVAPEALVEPTLQRQVFTDASRAKGNVSGVPHFTITHQGRAVELSGGQPSHVFASMFRRLVKARK